MYPIQFAVKVSVFFARRLHFNRFCAEIKDLCNIILVVIFRHYGS